MIISEREVLKSTLTVLKKVFHDWVQVERRQSAQFRNPSGQVVTFGRRNEPDIGGWVLRGEYIAKPLVIEVKRSDFSPSKIYGADKKRFQGQCDYIRDVISQGGIGFWLNNASTLYTVLMPVLMNGARVSLDERNHVIIQLK